jgi:hypothetical protein
VEEVMVQQEVEQEVIELLDMDQHLYKVPL